MHRYFELFLAQTFFNPLRVNRIQNLMKIYIAYLQFMQTKYKIQNHKN